MKPIVLLVYKRLFELCINLLAYVYLKYEYLRY